MAHALLAYYSVRLPKNQYPYVSMHTDYLYILTKNLTTQSAHQNYAVLPYEKSDYAIRAPELCGIALKTQLE